MSDPTGYRESPDTTDGPVAEDQTADPEADAPLTTDDEAQADDGVMRPGNVPD